MKDDHDDFEGLLGAAIDAPGMFNSIKEAVNSEAESKILDTEIVQFTYYEHLAEDRIRPEYDY